MIDVRPQVIGYRETMRELQKLDPALRRETVKEIRRAVVPLQQKARALYPASPPLSGMTRGRLAYTGKVRSEIRVRVGGRARRKSREWPLVALIQKNAAGSMVDMAGRGPGGSTPQGRVMIEGLNSRMGAASRAMWRVMDSGGARDVERNVLAAVERASQQINRKMAGYSLRGMG